MHIAEYKNIITDLRSEIEQLKMKLMEGNKINYDNIFENEISTRFGLMFRGRKKGGAARRQGGLQLPLRKIRGRR